jgi:hypothetical protein
MQRWEYLILDTKLHGNWWRPWLINGEEVSGWKNARIHPYLAHLGDQGWEMIALRAHADTETFVFKRPKP